MPPGRDPAPRIVSAPTTMMSAHQAKAFDTTSSHLAREAGPIDLVPRPVHQRDRAPVSQLREFVDRASKPC